MTIVEFKPREEEPEDGWIGGLAQCNKCRHEWAAVSPTGKVANLECPGCGELDGAMMHPIAAPENGEDFQCNCGSWYFAVYRVSGRTFVRCSNCGLDQTMNASQALALAEREGYTDVVVAYYDKDGTPGYITSAMSEFQAVFMLERAKADILSR